MRQKKLQRWCKKHEHGLIFSGALIVFCTFVIREGLGERWRHNAELVEGAENMQTIRLDMKDLSDSIRWVRKDLHGVREAIADINVKIKFDFRSDDYSLARFVTGEASDTIATIDSSLIYVKILTEVLPKDDPNRAKVDSITDGTADLRTKLRTVNSNYATTLETEDPKKWEKDIGSTYLAQVNSINDSTTRLSTEMDSLAFDVTQEAKQVREKNEKHAVLAKWISAFLFALGWGLGLLGKLHGVPEAASGE